jgi:hypothetical protein
MVVTSIALESALPTRTLVLLTLATIVACTDRPTLTDARCSTQNCMALGECHLRLFGSADEICVAAAIDAGYDVSAAYLQYCADACVANDAGALLQCLGQNFSGNTCAEIELDAGSDAELAAIVAACGAADAGPCGSNCVSCQQQCDQSNHSCNASCPLADAGACYACNYECNQQDVACYAACPTD